MCKYTSITHKPIEPKFLLLNGKKMGTASELTLLVTGHSFPLPVESQWTPVTTNAPYTRSSLFPPESG